VATTARRRSSLSSVTARTTPLANLPMPPGS
jgi:hypothetical protein